MGDPVIDAMNQMVSELGEPDLEATGLVKVYGDRTVVNGMNVNCRCGEIVGLLGPNGAGKTTTFYMIVGLVKPNEGKVTFRGRDLTNMPVFLRPNFLGSESDDQLKMAFRIGYLPLMPSSPSAVSSE